LLIYPLARFFLSEGEIWPHAGSLRKTKKTCPKYVQYAKYSRQPASFSKEFRQEAVDEFTKCLEETMLDSNDVKGIRKVRLKGNAFPRVYS
jgi:hypothetical protein